MQGSVRTCMGGGRDDDVVGSTHRESSPVNITNTFLLTSKQIQQTLYWIGPQCKYLIFIQYPRFNDRNLCNPSTSSGGYWLTSLVRYLNLSNSESTFLPSSSARLLASRKFPPFLFIKSMQSSIVGLVCSPSPSNSQIFALVKTSRTSSVKPMKYTSVFFRRYAAMICRRICVALGST